MPEPVMITINIKWLRKECIQDIIDAYTFAREWALMSDEEMYRVVTPCQDELDN